MQTIKSKYFSNIGYVPEKVQWDIHNSNARFRVNVQGRRSGKSYGAAREAETAILCHNTRGWIVAPTYDLANKISREIYDNLILTHKFPTKEKRMSSGQMFYAKFINNSEIWIKSAENPDSLIGEGLDWLIIDEAAAVRKQVWEQYLRPTLSDRQGFCVFSTTPRGYNWIYDLYQRGKSPDYELWESWRHPSWNSRYFRDDINELKRTLTKETFNQEYGAEFTSFAGKVYPFDRNIHVKKLEYNPAWETYCSIDFGYRMPAVVWVQCGRVRGEWVCHIIDCIVHDDNIKTEELARRIKGKYNVMRYYCDPAGKGVQSTSGLGDVEIFRREGINCNYRTDKISRSIPSGVDLVRSYLENTQGEARCYVKEGLGIIDDFEGYRYPEKKEDRILKDEPLKDGYHDHGMDAVRYFFINRFPLAGRIEMVSRYGGEENIIENQYHKYIKSLG